MVSLAMCKASQVLQNQGFHELELPHTDNTPIPGLLLFMDEGHQKLELVRPDGRAIDLLKVYHMAEDCIRNWHKDSAMPQFVGDFSRLILLAEAVNGRQVLT